MMIQLVRNATLLVNINQKKLLIDPMLGEIGSIKSVPFSKNKRKNPMTPLGVSLEDILNVDAVFVTHTHFDHFDEEAKRVLPKDITIFCQPEDKKIIEEAGFLSVIAIHDYYFWEGIKITRTTGKHGTGIAGFLMGSVSGFIIVDRNGEKLYIAGDTIYNNSVKETIHAFSPKCIVVNSGEARMMMGKPITMTKEEVVQVAKASGDSKVIAVHLEAVNHCHLSRAELRKYIHSNGMNNKVIVPNDAEILKF